MVISYAIDKQGNVCYNDVWKFEINLSAFRWQEAIDMFKETREVPLFVFRAVGYDGGLPETEMTAFILNTHTNFIKQLFETGKIQEWLR